MWDWTNRGIVSLFARSPHQNIEEIIGSDPLVRGGRELLEELLKGKCQKDGTTPEIEHLYDVASLVRSSLLGREGPVSDVYMAAALSNPDRIRSVHYTQQMIMFSAMGTAFCGYGFRLFMNRPELGASPMSYGLLAGAVLFLAIGLIAGKRYGSFLREMYDRARALTQPYLHERGESHLCSLLELASLYHDSKEDNYYTKIEAFLKRMGEAGQFVMEVVESVTRKSIRGRIECLAREVYEYMGKPQTREVFEAQIDAFLNRFSGEYAHAQGAQGNNSTPDAAQRHSFWNLRGFLPSFAGRAHISEDDKRVFEKLAMMYAYTKAREFEYDEAHNGGQTKKKGYDFGGKTFEDFKRALATNIPLEDPEGESEGASAVESVGENARREEPRAVLRAIFSSAIWEETPLQSHYPIPIEHDQLRYRENYSYLIRYIRTILNPLVREAAELIKQCDSARNVARTDGDVLDQVARRGKYTTEGVLEGMAYCPRTADPIIQEEIYLLAQRERERLTAFSEIKPQK